MPENRIKTKNRVFTKSDTLRTLEMAPQVGLEPTTS